MFRFKQFSVDQSGCAMKINTDGVLLGAMASANEPKTILDIGTGTGVIALMLAQRHLNTQIDAVEIDADAAKTAEQNFSNSPFADRLRLFPLSFESYFDQYPERKYDLIVSNPPFYTDSLKSPAEKRTVAKHTDIDFFETLIKKVSAHLAPRGSCWFILPNKIANAITDIALKYLLYPEKVVDIKSYQHSEPHRLILCYSFNTELPEISNFTIYEARDVYSDEYRQLLQPYFLAF